MNFVNNAIMNAASWTLIHSLWLGLVIALLAGLTILLTKKTASATRYNVLAILSVLFLVAVGFVFSRELSAQQTKAAATPCKEACETTASPYSTSFNPFIVKPVRMGASEGCSPYETVAAVVEAEPESPASAVSGFITKYADWIVWIWFLIFSVKCLSMASGLRHIYRVRNYQTVSPPEMWKQRLEELTKLLKIKRGVQLLESRLVDVPSVTGILKPMILVPIGLLNNLPQEQVEAILLHELAHIRRSDYAVNLVQSFIEIVFFFNPGILWISSLLKEERENCCDDLAISVTNDKKEFVHALVSFQEYNLSGQRFALQFGDKKMHLANRARRILFNHNKMLSKAEKYFLSICIAMGTTLCFAFVYMTPQQAVNNHPKVQTTLPPDSLVADTLYTTRKYNPKTIPEGTSLKFADVIKGEEYYTYIFKHRGVLYQVPETLENIVVNGKTVTGTEKEKYMPVINSLIVSYEQQIAETGELDELDPISQTTTDYYDETEAESRRIEAESRRIEAESRRIEIESRKIEKESLKIEKESRKIEKESRRIEEESRRIEAESRKIEQAAMAQSRVVVEDARRVEAQARTAEKAAKLAEIEARRMEKEADMTTGKIIRDIRNNGYKGEIHSFQLNNKKLMINGQRQPAELHEKLKKYAKPGTEIMYNIEITD